jgi:acetyl-CoA carboxylase biotin carboxylase subunit
VLKLKRLLVANRGEIAVRIIRACRELGIETVAVYSTADAESLPTRMADRAICIGPPPAAKSYLLRESLITAALRSGCEAIHPGVGFLSESAAFATDAADAGILFIGPRPETLALLGDKIAARREAKRQGLPVTPGTEDAVRDGEACLAAAREVGYPVIVKAAAGGGGKGMRIVRGPEEAAESIALAQREAGAAFGDSRVFIERYVENPRHVELQLLGDGKGGAAALGERDCTVQKQHQKLIEESPSPGLSPAMREDMARGAVNLFRALKYQGAGTVEFLVQGDEFYFMEVNARLQVEHPVTEMVTGIDLVRQQVLACCEGRIEVDCAPRGAEPAWAERRGWAVECRINAASPGKVTRLEVPGGPGIRFDSFLYPGCTVPPYYDALAAKVIAWAADRLSALDRMDRALSELVIEGLKTNQAEQRAIIKDEVFRGGHFGTEFYGSGKW